MVGRNLASGHTQFADTGASLAGYVSELGDAAKTNIGCCLSVRREHAASKRPLAPCPKRRRQRRRRHRLRRAPLRSPGTTCRSPGARRARSPRSCSGPRRCLRPANRGRAPDSARAAAPAPWRAPPRDTRASLRSSVARDMPRRRCPKRLPTSRAQLLHAPPNRRWHDRSSRQWAGTRSGWPAQMNHTAHVRWDHHRCSRHPVPMHRPVIQVRAQRRDDCVETIDLGERCIVRRTCFRARRHVGLRLCSLPSGTCAAHQTKDQRQPTEHSLKDAP